MLAVARPARDLRQVEQRVPALQPLKPQGGVAAPLRSAVGRSRLGIPDHRLPHRARPPARGGSQKGGLKIRPSDARAAARPPRSLLPSAGVAVPSASCSPPAKLATHRRLPACQRARRSTRSLPTPPTTPITAVRRSPKRTPRPPSQQSVARPHIPTRPLPLHPPSPRRVLHLQRQTIPPRRHALQEESP